MLARERSLETLIVGALLATVFMFSCSPDGGNEQNTSSSSDNQSSSSSIIAWCNGVKYNPYSHFCSYEGELITKGEITDDRDGKVYKIVTIYNQTWMAENLNRYTEEGSVCYDNDPANCTIYGRLYNWATADTICPDGWHLPSEDEWRELSIMAGGIYACNLKAINHWEYSENYLITDSYGFSALPGGEKILDFVKIADSGSWWHSSVFDGYYETGYVNISFYGFYFFRISNELRLENMFSVRCVTDD